MVGPVPVPVAMCRGVVVCHAGAALKGYRLATPMGCGAYGNFP